MIVIADDITGAAEIAGIAFSQGQQVRLVCGDFCGCDTATCGTMVIATDTRSMPEAEAVAETRRIQLPHSLDGRRLLFKKTDSALRGHVVGELTALMETAGYQRAVYLPANPSKGRIIKNGIYYIKEVRGQGSEIREVPIAETAFNYDPEFPARTSVVKERFPDAEVKGIIMPNAESEEDIKKVIDEYNDGKTLFAGAADLFKALLKDDGGGSDEDYGNGSEDSLFKENGITQSHPHHPSLSTLVLCGSTQSKPLDLGIPITPMPIVVYDGNEDISQWDTNKYQETHSLILTIPYTHRTGKETAVHLRTMMAQKAKELIVEHCPNHLIIEGGATAWATLQALGWNQFDIVAQIAPGVVQMSATNGTLVTLKPGSYSWGNFFSSSTNK